MRGGKEVCNGSPLRRYAPAFPEGEPLACRSGFHWTSEARYGAKGRAVLQRAGPSSYNLSVSADALPPPLVGEALAVRSVSCIFLPKFMVYLFCGSSPLSYGRGGGDMDIIFIRSPGCGSQRLLRPLVRASHPAGRCPNSSSLFPPLAAVVAVASGLANSTRTVSPTKWKAPGELPLLGGFSFRE